VAALRRPSSLRAAAATPHRGLVEAATLLSLYGVYEVVRGGGHATLGVARRHTDAIVSLEQHLHLYGERAVQHAVRSLPALPAVLGAAYLLLHFAGTLGFLFWTYKRRRESFPFIRNTLIAATAIALVVYVVYPAAPPRLAGLGFADTVSSGAHVNLSSNLLGSLYNPFAAVPSLHFGYALLVGIGVATLARRRAVRITGAIYPLVMLFVIVGTGNHFFFDALAGAAVLAAAAAFARAVTARPVARARPARVGSVVAPC
jgi:PAP2 superfamily